MVLWWIGGPTDADVQRASETLAGLAARPQASGLPHYISVVWSGSRPPDETGREAFLGLTDTVMSNCEQFHLVLDCNPFIKAIARGLIGASSIPRRHPGKVVIHDTLDQALMAVYDKTQDQALLRIEMPPLPTA